METERIKINKEDNTIIINGVKYEIGEKIGIQPDEYFWWLMQGVRTEANFMRFPGQIYFVDGCELIMCFSEGSEISSPKLSVSKSLFSYKIRRDLSYSNIEIRELIGKEMEKLLRRDDFNVELISHLPDDIVTEFIDNIKVTSKHRFYQERGDS